MDIIDIPVEEAITYWSGDYDRRFFDIVEEIFDECNETFISSLNDNGQVTPISLIDTGDTIIINDGHHRLAWAFFMGRHSVMATFSDDITDTINILSW